MLPEWLQDKELRDIAILVGSTVAIAGLMLVLVFAFYWS